MAPKLLVLAVEFHRAPLRFRHLTDRSQPLPDDFGSWLTESSAALSPGSIDATAAAMGLSPTALQESFLFFLRHTLLLPSADHYRVLGLSRHSSAETIKHNYSLLVRLFHPDRIPTKDERRVALTARINAAYHTLRDPEARAHYDRQLPPLPLDPDRHAQGRDFFQANDPIRPGAQALDHPHRKALRVRPLLLSLLGCVGLAALAPLVLTGPEEPALRMRPERAVSVAPSPAYLRKVEDETLLVDAEPDLPSGAIKHPASSVSPRTPLPSVVDTVSAPATAPTRLPEPHTVGSTPVAGPDFGRGTPRPPMVAQADRAPPDPPKSTTTAAPKRPYTDTAPPVMPLPASNPGRELSARGSDELRAGAELRERWRSSLTDKAAPLVPEISTSAPPAIGADPVPEPRIPPAPSRQATEPHRRTPPTKAEQDNSPGLAEAAGLISRLKRFYVDGDVHRLTGLFRADAVVNDGVGVASIRRQFSAVFERDPHRRISIFDLSWSQGPDKRLSGEGRIRVLGRESAASEWHLESGTIEFELVPWRGDYRIAKMIYHLSGR